MAFTGHKTFALGRLKAGELNQTEAAYRDFLELELKAGRVAWYRFEGVKLRLGDGCFYTPDFAVMRPGGELECHEVKGYFLGDGKTKLKVAAEMYPIRFVAVFGKKAAKRDGGAWVFTAEEF